MSVVRGKSVRGSRGLFGRDGARREVHTWSHAGCSTEHRSRATAQHCRVGRQPVQVQAGPSYRATAPGSRRDAARVAERLVAGLVRRLRLA